VEAESVGTARGRRDRQAFTCVVDPWRVSERKRGPGGSGANFLSTACNTRRLLVAVRWSSLNPGSLSGDVRKFGSE